MRQRQHLKYVICESGFMQGREVLAESFQLINVFSIMCMCKPSRQESIYTVQWGFLDGSGMCGSIPCANNMFIKCS